MGSENTICRVAAPLGALIVHASSVIPSPRVTFTCRVGEATQVNN